MKESTVVCAKLFLILIISTKPLGLNGHGDCKRLGNNSCLSNNECCSGYCYKEPGWELGVCKREENDGNSEDVDDVYNSKCDITYRRVFNLVEKGVCAYYKGPPLLTANGELFDLTLKTAAHRTLPFNTKVKVEILGDSVIVRINDRLNDSSPHILDMSYAASQNIDITKKGAVQCQIRIVNIVGCLPNLGEPCYEDHECCSEYCFREIYSELGFCLSKD